MDGLRTCIGTRTCLSVSVPSGPLSLHPVRAPPAARPAPCVLGTAHTVDESEESKNKSHIMFYTELKLPWILWPLGYRYTCIWSPLSRACQQCSKLKVGRGFRMLHLKSPVSELPPPPWTPSKMLYNLGEHHQVRVNQYTS